MQRLKPWLSNFPVMLCIGWLVSAAWISKGSSSFFVLVLGLGVFGLSLYGVFWVTEKIFDLMTGTKRNRQQADNTCSLSDIGSLDLENIKFDIPTEHHVAALFHLPDCEDIVSSCVEVVSSCLEGLQP
jgi:hypothetical protein